MEVIRHPREMLQWSQRVRTEGNEIGFVPTMGYLHEGHLSLCRLARSDGGRTVASVYVNPTQFCPGEDFEHYPRDENRDLELLRNEGIDAVFLPTSEMMYPPEYSTYVETGGPSEGWCGASRPIHFRGVTTIVTQLFHLVLPHRAYFGQKDAQQVAVVHRMVCDLKFGIEIVVGETMRERDGLAMSSRNAYLSTEERHAALVLYRSLSKARSLYKRGERDGVRLVEAMRSTVQSEPLARLDYVGVVDRASFRSVETVGPSDLLIGAIHVGSTRLIDNLDVSPQVYPLRMSHGMSR